MNGRKAVIGLSLLSVLMFSALAAQSASAAAAKNTTLFTCIKVPDKTIGPFKDAHCDVKKDTENGYTHAVLNEPNTPIIATNDTTAVKSPSVLKGTVAGVGTQIECTETVGEGEVTNEEPVAKEHKFKIAKANANYTKCTVVKPAKCAVKEPIVVTATAEGVEGLEGPKGEANAMGQEFKGSGKEGAFTEITFEGKECALNAKTFPVTGSAIGTSGPGQEEAQTNKHSGATLIFNPKAKMQSLVFGVLPAEYTGVLTPYMWNKALSKEENPITATTTT